MHGYMFQRVLESDVFLGNSLVVVYAKYGHIEIVWKLFNIKSRRNVVLWDMIIANYTQNGRTDGAWKLFHQMQCIEVIPDLVTIESALQAYANLENLL